MLNNPLRYNDPSGFFWEDSGGFNFDFDVGASDFGSAGYDYLSDPYQSSSAFDSYDMFNDADIMFAETANIFSSDDYAGGYSLFDGDLGSGNFSEFSSSSSWTITVGDPEYWQQPVNDFTILGQTIGFRRAAESSGWFTDKGDLLLCINSACANNHSVSRETVGQFAVYTGMGMLIPGPDGLPSLKRYGPNDPPVRIDGIWSDSDIKNALRGRPPKGLGSPDLHHADQMPGSAIHEILPWEHRGNKALHPNKYNQGVTPKMRQQDKQLHWWYRAREQGADQRFPDLIYNNR